MASVGRGASEETKETQSDRRRNVNKEVGRKVRRNGRNGEMTKGSNGSRGGAGGVVR